MIARYKKLFRSNPELGLLALFGLLHLTLLLATDIVQQVKLMLHVLLAR